MKKTVLTLLFGLVCVLFMHAQQTVVKGQVIDSDTTNPIPGVSVSIEGTKLAQQTNEQGEFNFSSNVPLGNQQLIITKEGYLFKQLAILVEEGETVYLSTIILNEYLGDTSDFTISLS